MHETCRKTGFARLSWHCSLKSKTTMMIMKTRKAGSRASATMTLNLNEPCTARHPISLLHSARQEHNAQLWVEEQSPYWVVVLQVDMSCKPSTAIAIAIANRYGTNTILPAMGFVCCAALDSPICYKEPVYAVFSLVIC